MTSWADANGYWSSIDSGIIFTNIDATADGDTASCMSHNDGTVWFKVNPDNSIYGMDIDVKTGSAEGTIRYLSVSIWIDTSGAGQLIEIKCESTSIGHAFKFNDVSINNVWQVSPAIYYINVQSSVSGIEGSFSIEFDLLTDQEAPSSLDLSLAKDLIDYNPDSINFWIFSADSTSRHNNNPPPIDCYYPEPCDGGIENPYFGGANCLPPSYEDPYFNKIDRFGTYGSDPRQKYYVYLPDTITSSTEVIVLIHGGAWFRGPNPATINGFIFNWGDVRSESLVKDLLNEGYIVVSLLYRLTKYFNDGDSPNTDVTFAEQIDDVEAAVNHIHEYFPSCFGIDGDDIHILGESAGGHLALMFTYLRADDDYVKSVISMYAPTDMQKFGDYLNTTPDDILGIALFPFECNDWVYIEPNVFLLGHFPYYIRLDIYNQFEIINSNQNDCGVLIEEPEDTVIRIFEGMNITEAACGKVISNPLTDGTLFTYSPYNALNNSTTEIPTFIMHGNDDQLSPYSLTSLMVTALTNNGGIIQTINTATDSLSTMPTSYAGGDHLIKMFEGANHGWVPLPSLFGGINVKDQVRSDVITWLANH